MPRISYGNGMGLRAWQIVESLFKALDDSKQDTVEVKKVKITRWDQDNAPGPSLKVEGKLNDLANLAELTGEQVRESLTRHLMDYLEIAVDKSPQKLGRNSGN